MKIKNVQEKDDLQSQNKKTKLKEKGITLIALVVTIIILLILVGVTLNMTMSGDGLFSKAKNAVERYKKAQEDEKNFINDIAKVKEIDTAEGLKELAKEVNAGENYFGYTINLMSDIDLKDVGEWIPIGTIENPFEGTFEGNYHKIDGITINTMNDNQRIIWSKWWNNSRCCCKFRRNTRRKTNWRNCWLELWKYN